MITPLTPQDLTLETPRLRLTPMVREDIDIATELLCDDRVMRYVDDAMTAEAVEEHMPDAVKRGAGGRIGIWLVTLKETGEKIGDVILLPVPIDEDDTDWSLLVEDAYPPGQIEVGYLFKPNAWGHGFATEACSRMVRFAFEHTALSEVVATTDPDNVNSHNVLQKSGLRKIGLKRAYAHDNVLWFELTRDRWDAMK